MPHVVYLHSGLTQRRVVPRNDGEKWKIYRFSKKEVVIAMTLAGLINLSMRCMAASVFHATEHSHIAQVPQAYQTLTPILGSAAAAVFLVSLMASGINPTKTLVLSQVLLSLILPIPILTLIYFTSKRDVMGVLVNQRYVKL